MHHSKIVAPADIHAAWCNCRDCHQSRDALAFARHRRVVRAQAAVLIGFAIVIYALIVSHTGAIAASFGVAG